MKKKQPRAGYGKWADRAWRYLWNRGLFRRIVFVVLAIVFIFGTLSWAVGEWYIQRHKNEPIVLGASFIPDYAAGFGLDPMQTLQAMLSDLHLKQVRLVSYWSDIEKTSGKYDFSQLDQEFALANKYGAKVSLSVGLRQPRWPECHPPGWIDVLANNEPAWRPQLNEFIKTVVNRYKLNPALQDYELENEYFMKVFGTCTDFSRQRLADELKLVKNNDSRHPVIISRSDNWVGIPVGQPKPDEYAISIYKRVWDATFTHRYFEYPLPAWFYSALAGYEEIYSGKNMIVHELQAEPWTPKGMAITDTSLKEQFKSMDAARLKDRIAYGEATGMKTIDLWGAEWWYWLKTVKHDPSVWNTVKQAVADADQHNRRLAVTAEP